MKNRTRAGAIVAILAMLAMIFGATPAQASQALCGSYGQSPSFNCVSYSGFTGQRPWGYPVDSNGHNCTNYVTYRLWQNGVKNPGNLGNAYQWNDRAALYGIPVSNSPVVGSVAVWEINSGPALGSGHVAYVEAVTSTYVDVSEDNYGGTTMRKRFIIGQSDWPDHFIHFKGISNSAPIAGPNDPKGNFESIRQVSGGISLSGWVLDPNTSDPISVHVYEGDGFNNPRGAFTASDSRPDVGTIYPSNGSMHGFGIFFPMPNGTGGSKTYCVYGINVGAGSINPKLGCRTVTFNWNPVGNYEGIFRSPGGVNLVGWTLDPETSDSIPVHVYEGPCCNNARAAVMADISRPDVSEAMPGYGANHGFDVHVGAFPTSPTSKTYCTYGYNVGYGNASPELGCRSITVSPNAEGNYESLESIQGGVRVSGWAIDPDVYGPVPIHAYVDGAIANISEASSVRADVANYWPYYGEEHGFDIEIATSPGTHDVCVFALNDSSTPGSNLNMGCKTVSVN